MKTKETDYQSLDCEITYRLRIIGNKHEFEFLVFKWNQDLKHTQFFSRFKNTIKFYIKRRTFQFSIGGGY